MQRYRELGRELDLEYPPYFPPHNYPASNRSYPRPRSENGTFDLIGIILLVGIVIYIIGYAQQVGIPGSEKASSRSAASPSSDSTVFERSTTPKAGTPLPAPEHSTPTELSKRPSGDYELAIALEMPYTLQAGYFTNREGALRIIADLDFIKDEFIFLWESKSTSEYRVLVGAAPGADGLSQIAAKLEKKGIVSWKADLHVLKNTGTITPFY